MVRVILVIAVALMIAVLFGWSASSGKGWASRIVQFIYYRVASLDRYQKSDRVFPSAVAVFASRGDPAFAPLLRRIAPSQVDWFSRRLPTDKGSYHGYLPLYDALLAPYLALAAPRILEVGVKKGGSLVLWRELFHDGAFIYGIDVNPDVPTFTRDARIKVLVLDSTNEPLVKRALRGLRFDVIIDDGWHVPDAQLRTFTALYPFLEPTGVYVIEDVYEIDVTQYEAYGLTVAVHPDATGQSLVVLYPPDSLAPRAPRHPAAASGIDESS